MEVGTALAVLAMIKPTIQTIVEMWQDTKQFGGDFRALSIRFNASHAHLLHYDNFLFTRNKLPGISGTLYDALPESERRIMFDMLSELYMIVSIYVETSKRYELERSKSPNKIDLEQFKESREAMLLASADAKIQEQSKAVGWVKKTWWTVWEKKGVEKLVRDFEEWVKRLRDLVKLVWGPLTFLNSLSQLQHLEKDQDAEELGLLEDVPLRKLILAPVGTQMMNVEMLRTTISAVLVDAKDHRYGHMGSSKVFLEFKPYEVNRVNVISDLAFNRISRLIALLHETKNESFKVLRCINYFDDSPKRSIGVIFEFPPSLDGPPNSLLSALSCSSSSRPSLDARMKLARSLCETLLHLHSVNWLHKSIRSENILLLNPSPTPPTRDTIPDLENPRLSGFEYSRLDNDFTSGNSDYELARNIYRHPQRWNDPTESFSKIHDIYALGVILLEIGLWESVITLGRKAPLMERYKDGDAAKERYLKYTKSQLGFYAGEKYQDLVRRCLEGDFGDLSGDDKTGSGLQREFGRAVTLALAEDKKLDP